MTNGEKIKELFPHFDVEDKTEYFGRIRNLDDHFIKADIDFWNAEYKEPTNKNNLPHCQCTDAEIAKSFIEDVEAVKDQLPTAKNDLGVDCIDRQAAITFVCKNTEEILKDTIPLEVKLSDDYLYENVAKIMRNPKVLPSVTPIRPKGHWISHREHCEMNNLLPSGLGILYWCSECDCAIDSKYFHRVNYNFCPNCGADMREVDDGNDD